MIEEKKGVPPWAYLLGGVAAGAVLGVLFAPKKGSELRADIGDWTKQRREQAKALLNRAETEIPSAMKHAKERAQEAIAAVRGKTEIVKS